MSCEPNAYVMKWGKILIVLALLVLVLAGVRTISQPDVWMHLASGRWQQEHGLPQTETTDPFSYTSADASWINTTWLYDRLLYGVWEAAGPAGITILHISALAGAFLLLLPLTRKYAGPFATALGLLFSTCMLLPFLEVRPHIFSLFFIALFMALLSSRCRIGGLLLLLLPLQILWTNMSISFLFGPLIIAIYTFQTFRGNDENRPVTYAKKMLVLFIAVFAVTLVSPYGAGIYQQALAMWQNPGLSASQVWQAPFRYLLPASLFKHIITLALITGAGGMILYKGRLPFSITVLAIIGALMAVYTRTRYSDFFAVMAFPFFCLSFSTWGDSIKTYLKNIIRFSTAPFRVIGSLIILLLIVLTCWLIISNTYYTRHGYTCGFGLGVEYDMFPETASVILDNEHFPERTIHLVNDGAFLAWRYPARKIFIDGRTELYGQAFYNELSNGLMRGSRNHRLALFEQWQPEAIILNMTTPFSDTATIPLLNEKNWGLTYFDGTTAIMLNRDILANRDLVSRSIWQAGQQILDDEFQAYKKSIGGWQKSPLSPRLIGAGNLFMSLGRYRKAAAIYAVLARANPKMAMAWLNLGICQIQLDTAPDSIHSIQQACDLQPRNPMCWLWLSRAYAASGNPEKAQNSFQTAQHLNPSMAEAFGDPNI